MVVYYIGSLLDYKLIRLKSIRLEVYLEWKSIRMEV